MLLQGERAMVKKEPVHAGLTLSSYRIYFIRCKLQFDLSALFAVDDIDSAARRSDRGRTRADARHPQSPHLIFCVDHDYFCSQFPPTPASGNEDRCAFCPFGSCADAFGVCVPCRSRVGQSDA